MSNYIVTTDFAAKDALPSGNPGKVAQGTQVDTEFDNIAVAVATKEDTANKGSANGYAGLDSGAKVPKAQLPTAGAYEDEANVFTSNQEIENTGPTLILDETDAAANERTWLLRSSGGALAITVSTDAAPATPVNNAVVIDRTGTTVDSIALAATTVTVNGQDVRNAAILNAGSLADARVAQSNVTQHQAALALAGTQLTSGSIPDARVPLSNVSQHQASIQTRNITGKTGTAKTLSTSAASGGSDGDIWYRY